jgi:hypothetical protein
MSWFSSSMTSASVRAKDRILTGFKSLHRFCRAFETSKRILGARNICVMPEKETMERAREDEREGKSPSTQAGEFVREEMDHIREGKHGASSAKQAIAIGLSKARRAGVKLPPPKKGTTSTKVRKQAMRDSAKGASKSKKKPSATRSRAVKKALRRKPHAAASHRALSRQAHSAARKRGAGDRSAAAKKAAKTRKRNRR